MPTAAERKYRDVVWASLLLAQPSAFEIEAFFTTRGWARREVKKRMHITIYHARRKLHGLVDQREIVEVAIPTELTRMMVLAPGGERQRPDVDQASAAIGLRVQRPGRTEINALRERMIGYETSDILGERKPSSLSDNAFGARKYQPHMTLLEPGAGAAHDLSDIGRQFREAVTTLTFDRFEVRCRYDRTS